MIGSPISTPYKNHPFASKPSLNSVDALRFALWLAASAFSTTNKLSGGREEKPNGILIGYLTVIKRNNNLHLIKLTCLTITIANCFSQRRPTVYIFHFHWSTMSQQQMCTYWKNMNKFRRNYYFNLHTYRYSVRKLFIKLALCLKLIVENRCESRETLLFA